MSVLREENLRLHAELDAAQVALRALVRQPRPDDDPARSIWDAEQRADLLRRQVEDLTRERDETAAHDRLVTGIAERASIELDRVRAEAEVLVKWWKLGSTDPRSNRRIREIRREAGLR